MTENVVVTAEDESVPLMVPERLSVRPAGNEEPGARDQMYDPAPPVATN